jgi:long-chain acyl-CoA synthetase
MREFTGPGEIEIPKESNLTEPLWRREQERPDYPALAYRSGNQFVDVTTRQFAEKVRDLAAGLIGLGVEPGQRVVIMSKTRIEWTYLDYAIWAAGAATVPIYETSSREQIEWIVGNSGAVVVVAENAALREDYDKVAGSLDAVRHVFVIEDGGLDAIATAGENVDRGLVDERARSVTTEDMASIVYTSGTTGRPKGCVITHGNLRWTFTQVSHAIGGIFKEGESTLLFLPLAHIFGRVIETAAVSEGVKLGYSTGIENLRDELQMFRPTFILSVPRVFEKVYNGAQTKAAEEGKGKIFNKAADVAIDYSRGVRGRGVGLVTRVLHWLFDKLVYGKLRDAVGGRVRYAVSGGAALGERLGHFFDGVGITILEGYGLTETAAGATINTPEHLRIGSVGRPLPGCTVRIDDSGEILLRGAQVFPGYWENDEATREVLTEDGWFRTGDLGDLDDTGFLHITGRQKEIIVTAGGKNVAPNVLEDRLRRHPLISQAMVVGDAKPFIGALITIDEEELPRWAEEHGKQERSLSELADDPELRATVEEAVQEANEAVSRAESIREFRILPEDFTVGEELTPTMKVRRDVVADRYAPILEEIYAGRGGGS